MKLAEQWMKLAKHPSKRVVHPTARSKIVGSKLCVVDVSERVEMLPSCATWETKLDHTVISIMSCLPAALIYIFQSGLVFCINPTVFYSNTRKHNKEDSTIHTNPYTLIGNQQCEYKQGIDSKGKEYARYCWTTLNIALGTGRGRSHEPHNCRTAEPGGIYQG